MSDVRKYGDELFYREYDKRCVLRSFGNFLFPFRASIMMRTSLYCVRGED